MKTSRESVAATPIIAAAMRRRLRGGKGGGGGEKIPHNYLAETSLTPGQASKTAKRPGAPPGNLNAIRHGKGNPDIAALFASVRAFERRARAAMRLAKLAQREGRKPDPAELRAVLTLAASPGPPSPRRSEAETSGGGGRSAVRREDRRGNK